MNIAVVGAGIYGITIATKLAKKHSVTLFEAEDDILKCASGSNQFRIHKGYHYPRSTETTLSSILSEPSFKQEYQEAIIDTTENFYAIANSQSLISASEYLRFLKKHDLEYTIQDHPLLNKKSVDLCIKAEESLIDPHKLRQVCYEKIKKNGVNLKLKTKATSKTFKYFNHTIICTYVNINSLIPSNTMRSDLQFELCEQFVIKLPPNFHNQSIVIMDGPFMCIDPYGKTGLFLLYDVEQSIHQRTIGKKPLLLNKYNKLLNKGLVFNSPITNFKKSVKKTQHFIPLIKKAEYIGSIFTYRTVQPNKESTDERVTVVHSITPNIHSVFSGKIVNCVVAAEHINNLLQNTNHFLPASASK